MIQQVQQDQARRQRGLAPFPDRLAQRPLADLHLGRRQEQVLRAEEALMDRLVLVVLA